MKNYPTFKQAIWLLLLLWSVEFTCTIIASIIRFEIGLDRPSRSELAWIIGTGVGCFVIWWGWRRTGASFRSVFPLSRVRLLLLFPLSLTVIGGGIVISEIDNLVRITLPIPEVWVRAYSAMRNDASATFLILVPVLCAPILEEGLFRGLILNGFLRNYRKENALVCSALLFGLLHMNPWQFIGAFIMGVVFGWWFLRTQTLWPCLVGHALNNLLAAFFSHFELPGLIAKTDYTKPVEFQPWWLDLSGLLLMILGLWWFSRASNGRKPNGVRHQDVEGQKG